MSKGAACGRRRPAVGSVVGSFTELLVRVKPILSTGADRRLASCRSLTTIAQTSSTSMHGPTNAPSTSPKPRLVALGAAVALVAMGVLLGACGGSGSQSSSNAPAPTASNARRSSGSSPATSGQSRADGAETELVDKFVEFARCLRHHGVNAEVRPGGHGLKIAAGELGPAAMEAAEKACARYRPPPQNVNVSPQQRVEQEGRDQKFARCMREHGVTVEANPTGGLRLRIGPGNPKPESPAFQHAQSACQKLALPSGAGSP
jgi:hypothetical protein